jgi:hypothetical protein
MYARGRDVAAAPRRSLDLGAVLEALAVGRATITRTTIGRATITRATVGRATITRTTIGRATITRTTIGRATITRATVGRAAVGLTLCARVARRAQGTTLRVASRGRPRTVERGACAREAAAPTAERRRVVARARRLVADVAPAALVRPTLVAPTALVACTSSAASAAGRSTTAASVVLTCHRGHVRPS